MNELRDVREELSNRFFICEFLKSKVLLTIFTFLILFNPVGINATLTTFRAISNASELKDGDKVIIVSRGTSSKFNSQNLAIGNKFNGYNGLNVFNISEYLNDGTVTLDDDSGVAVFTLKQIEKGDGYYYFAMQSSIRNISDDSTGVYWLKNGVAMSTSGLNMIGLAESIEPSAECYARFNTASDATRGSWIRFTESGSHNLAYDVAGYFRLSNSLSNNEDPLYDTWFVIYVAQGTIDPTEGEAAFSEPEYELIVDSEIELNSILTSNSNAEPEIVLANVDDEQVSADYYSLSTDKSNPILKINVPGIYNLKVTYPGNSYYTSASASTRIIVPDKDYSLWFTIDGEKIDSDSLTGIAPGVTLAIECVSESAQIFYTDSFAGETEREYLNPLTVRSGRTEYVAIAYFNEKERARTKLVVRTESESPAQNNISFDDDYGLTTGLTGDEYEPLPLNIEFGNITLRAASGEKIRLSVANDNTNILEIAPQASLTLATNDKSVRLTSISLSTVGDVELDLYNVDQLSPNPEDNPQTVSKRIIKRAEENDSELAKIGKLAGQGNAMWDDTGDVDLSQIQLKNNTDSPAYIRSLSASTAAHTITGIDTIFNNSGFPDAELNIHDGEWFSISGVKIINPSSSGLYILRNPKTGRTRKVFVK